MLGPPHDLHIFLAHTSLDAIELLENLCYDKFILSLAITALLLKIISC